MRPVSELFGQFYFWTTETEKHTAETQILAFHFCDTANTYITDVRFELPSELKMPHLISK